MIKRLTEYDFPNDLKSMSIEEMELLSYDIRDFLLDKVSKTGGHLASNLGVVELTLALHYFFDSPKDKIVWDVGHQSYVHKILTGRAGEFDSLRQLDGISGFPRTSESIHDVLDMGHSSTSISLAAGLAAARDLNGDNYSVIAVIGDGALTGGLAYEALNNVGDSKSNVIVILNDNQMSISKNTGGVSQHLSKLRTSKGYLDFKNQIKNTLRNMPGIYQGVEHLKDTLKYAMVDGALFEELGFTYLPPIDGHNIQEILDTLSLAKRVSGPVLVHVITKKGKGYRNAEQNPNKFHGIGPFNTSTGELKNKSSKPSYSKVFGDKLASMAETNQNIIAVCAAMTSGTGLENFSRRYPERFFDVGIAEEYAVSFAAGMARSGKRPFVAIYSTFLQRAYDQIMMDVAINKLPVVFAIDRAGIVGEDGETHHGIFDISYLSHIPNLTVLSPADDVELEEMMEYAISLDGPCAIRYPRGTTFHIEEKPAFTGKNYLLETGKDVEIWASGKMMEIAMQVTAELKNKGYEAGLVNVPILSPLDTSILNNRDLRYGRIVTIEDNVFEGGFGQTLNSFILQNELPIKVKNIAWPKSFIEHGNSDLLLKRYDMDKESITERICDFIEGKTGYFTSK